MTNKRIRTTTTLSTTSSSLFSDFSDDDDDDSQGEDDFNFDDKSHSKQKTQKMKNTMSNLKQSIQKFKQTSSSSSRSLQKTNNNNNKTPSTISATSNNNSTAASKKTTTATATLSKRLTKATSTDNRTPNIKPKSNTTLSYVNTNALKTERIQCSLDDYQNEDLFKDDDDGMNDSIFNDDEDDDDDDDDNNFNNNNNKSSFSQQSTKSSQSNKHHHNNVSKKRKGLTSSSSSVTTTTTTTQTIAKATKRTKNASELRMSGKEQMQIDEIYDLLRGLRPESDDDCKSDCASNLADMCFSTTTTPTTTTATNTNTNTTPNTPTGIPAANDDFCVFLRAHNMISTVLDHLTLCFNPSDNNNNNNNNSILLSMLLSQIMSFLLSDPLNVDYLTMDHFQVIHQTIQLHPLLQKLNHNRNNNNSQSTNSSQSVRRKRVRTATLSITNYKHLDNSQQRWSQSSTSGGNSGSLASNNNNFSDEEFKTSCISRALHAMSTIVVRQQAKMEQSLTSGSLSNLTEAKIEQEKQSLFFHASGALNTIEQLVPGLLLQMENKRDDRLASDLCKCIRMLERSGLYKKYSKNDDSTHDAWNTLLPALIQCLQCLSSTGTNKNSSLHDLPESSPIVECTVAVLTFLTNITNKNEDACNFIALENGLSIIAQVLASNHNKHFDVVTLCCGLLSNMTEENRNAREILKDVRLPEPHHNKKFCKYVAELFCEFYEMVHRDELVPLEDKLEDQHQEMQPETLDNRPQQQVHEQLKSRKPKKHHMENLIIASYIGIVIGCLIRNHEKNREDIRKSLPNRSFSNIAQTLQQFIIFQSKAKMLLHDTYTSINDIITELRSMDDSQQHI